VTTLFTELRELVFAKATQGATRQMALQTFEHLHALSLRFHLERQTGGMTRDIERGVRAIESLISYSPTPSCPRWSRWRWCWPCWAAFDAGSLDHAGGAGAYIVFTVWVTEWRTQFRREANEPTRPRTTRPSTRC
jgi:ATP-binding cassette subfamily B protein